MTKVKVEETDAMALGMTVCIHNILYHSIMKLKQSLIMKRPLKQALTAYFGFLKVGAASSKDRVVVVSGAAGATGSNVTQIAKNVLGIETVIGIADSDEKC